MPTGFAGQGPRRPSVFLSVGVGWPIIIRSTVRWSTQPELADQSGARGDTAESLRRLLTKQQRALLLREKPADRPYWEAEMYANIDGVHLKMIANRIVGGTLRR